MKKSAPGRGRQRRLSARMEFPDDERVYPWLSHLLDAYAILDTGVAVAVRETMKRNKTPLACAKGCDACCSQKDIPLYSHELIGIYWYAAEKITGTERTRLKAAIIDSRPGAGCPFLIDSICIVHPVRPFSCRQFNVFGSRCTYGEDPYFTRPWDVLAPRQDYIDRAFETVIPLYNIGEGMERDRAAKQIRSQAMNLRTFDWKGLAAAMEKAERRG